MKCEWCSGTIRQRHGARFCGPVCRHTYRMERKRQARALPLLELARLPVHHHQPTSRLYAHEVETLLAIQMAARLAP